MPIAFSLPHKEPYIYQLHLQGEHKLRNVHRKTRNGAECEYDAVVKSNRCPKLYVVRNKKKEILYVGYASQPISSRMRYGLKPDSRNGYHGYGWMGESEVELLVWVFSPFGHNEEDNKVYKPS